MHLTGPVAHGHAIAVNDPNDARGVLAGLLALRDTLLPRPTAHLRRTAHARQAHHTRGQVSPRQVTWSTMHRFWILLSSS